MNWHDTHEASGEDYLSRMADGAVSGQLYVKPLKSGSIPWVERLALDHKFAVRQAILWEIQAKKQRVLHHIALAIAALFGGGLVSIVLFL